MALVSLEELKLLHRNICQALSDPRRIQILYLLREQPMNVSAITEALDMPQPTVSRHLSILRQRTLVSTERDGTSIIYSLADPRITDILDQMRELLRDMLERQSDMLD